MHSLYELVKVQADRAPEATAIVGLQSQPLTYGRLTAHIQMIAGTLNGLGIGREDRVAIILPNGPEMAVAFVSVSCAAAAAPLNPSYRQAEFEFYLSDLSAKALIVPAGTDSPAVDVAHDRGIAVIELRPAEDGATGSFTLEGTPQSLSASPGMAHPEDVALWLHTSGTTSRPKLVPLTHRNLYASAESVRETLQLTERDRCLNVMPLFHIHGLVASVLASLAAGASVVCTPGFYASEFYEWIAAFDPTWYTAVPTMHQAILSRAGANREIVARSGVRFIRSSSAALAPQVMIELENTFHAPVIEAYGMTEAAHQMASNPLPPRQRKPGSVGPAAGPAIAVMPENGNTLLPFGTRGEIVIRGPNVTSGYVNNREANARAFEGEWFRTGDEGFMDEEGYLSVTGRLKEIINRGGEKIAPREVDEALLSHPGVVQAVTFAVPDPVLGQDVAAAVVLRDPRLGERELRHFAALRLAGFKVPRRIVVLDEIPKGPTGKLQRIGLAEKLGLDGATLTSQKETTPCVAPRTDLEKILADLWCQVLRLPDVSVEQDFIDAGGDSISAARLVDRIREVFEVEMLLLDFFDASTIARQGVLLQSLLVKELKQSGAPEQ
jgi:oxalate---CoA ligase